MNKKLLKIMIVSVLLLLVETQVSPAQGLGSGFVQLSTGSLDEWKLRGPGIMSKWAVGDAEIDPKGEEKLIILPLNEDTPPSKEAAIVNRQKGIDLYTKQSFGDCVLDFEVMLPKKSNSGIYLMGRYEVQVKDSYGKGENLKSDDMGGIFETSRPLRNAAGKPGEWQIYAIEFKAPRFENGKRIEPAEFVKVILNGQIIQKNVKMEAGPTKGAWQEKEAATGPILLQGSMGPVAYRNIRIRLLER